MEVSQWSSSDLPCGDCGCAPGCTANPGRRCPVRAYLCYICRRVLFYEFLSGAVRRCIYCGGTNLTRMAPPSSHRCVHPHPQAFLPSRHGNRRLCGSRPSGVHASIRYRVSHGPVLVHVSTSVFHFTSPKLKLHPLHRLFGVAWLQAFLYFRSFRAVSDPKWLKLFVRTLPTYLTEITDVVGSQVAFILFVSFPRQTYQTKSYKHTLLQSGRHHTSSLHNPYLLSLPDY